MFKMIKKSLKTATVTGQYTSDSDNAPPVQCTAEAKRKAKPFRKSLTIREVDTGSCNACEMEMNALTNAVYDIERFGVHIAASPRHADALVVTGPVEAHDDTVSNQLVVAGAHYIDQVAQTIRLCGVWNG